MTDIIDVSDDIDYIRYLQENTLYDEETKSVFIDSETDIINAFAFNFLGILGSYNASKLSNQKPVAKNIVLYFKGDKQLRINNIIDDNNNISLVLKLMTDKHMFISTTKVNEMTRFLVLAKMGQVDNVDDDIIRGWVDNIKQNMIMKADPRIRPIIQGFKDGKLTLVEVSKVLRKLVTRFLPISAEYKKLSTRVKFVDTIGKVGSAGIGDNNDAIGLDDNKLDTVDVDPVPEKPEPEVIKTWRDYDHEHVVYTKVISKLNEITKGKGLVGLSYANQGVMDDDNISDYSFNINDSEQLQEMNKLNKLYNDLMDSFYTIGKALNTNLVDTMTTIKLVAETYPKLTTRYKEDLELLKLDNGIGQFTSTVIYDNTKTIVQYPFNIHVSMDLFNLSIYELMQSYLNSNYNKQDPLSVLSSGSIERYEDKEIVDYLEQLYGNDAIGDVLLILLNRSSSTNAIELMSSGLFNNFYAFNKIVSDRNKLIADNYKKIALSKDYYNSDIRKLTDMIRPFFVISCSDDVKYTPHLSFIDTYFMDLEQFEDYTFIEAMGDTLARTYNLLYPIATKYYKSSAYDRCMRRYIANVAYDRYNGHTLDSINSFFEENKDFKQDVMPKLLNDFKNSRDVNSDIPKLVFGNANTEADYRKGVNLLLDNLGDDPLYGIYSVANTLKYKKNTDERNAGFLELYTQIGDKYDVTNNELVYNFVGQYDFNQEHSIELMKLEIKNGFKLFDPEKIKAISYRVDKDKTEQMMLDLLINGMKTDPDTCNEFYEHMDNYYKKRIKDRLTSIEFVFGQLRNTELDMFNDNLSNKRINQVFKFNGIDPKELVKDVKLPTVRKEKFSDYIKRVEEYSKSDNKVVPDVKIEDVDMTPEMIVNKSEFLLENYYAGKHGDVYPLIKKTWNVNLPVTNYQNFFTECENDGTLSQIIPAFHGTSGVAANMILRYGFRVIPKTDSSAVGRALGDGIYFSNMIDKVLQYVGDGYNRQKGKFGYVFEMESILGKPRIDYNSAGFDGATTRSKFRSPEWVVYDANKQLKITKVYQVELNTKKNYTKYINDLKSQYINESKGTRGFKNVITEAKTIEAKNKLVYHFYDGKIPMMQDGKFQYIDADKVIAPKGFSIYKDVRGVAIVEIPSNKTEFNSYFYGKELKNKDLSVFLNLFEKADKY